MSELKYQAKIVRAFRQAGGFGEKLSHRFKAGFPDLWLKLPSFPMLFVECKFVERARMDYKPIPVALTPLQRKTLKDLRQVCSDAFAVSVGWAVFHKIGKSVWVYSGDDLEVERFAPVPGVHFQNLSAFCPYAFCRTFCVGARRE